MQCLFHQRDIHVTNRSLPITHRNKKPERCLIFITISPHKTPLHFLRLFDIHNDIKHPQNLGQLWRVSQNFMIDNGNWFAWIDCWCNFDMLMSTWRLSADAYETIDRRSQVCTSASNFNTRPQSNSGGTSGVHLTDLRGILDPYSWRK